jgi:hypothetical protein
METLTISKMRASSIAKPLTFFEKKTADLLSHEQIGGFGDENEPHPIWRQQK